MDTAKQPQMCQQFSAWNSSYLDHMALQPFDQNYRVSSFPPSRIAANLAFPAHFASDLCGLNTGQRDEVGRFSKLIAPHCNISQPMGNPYMKDSQCAVSGLTDMPIEASRAPQKKFLIFDQSGNHTRLFFSPSLSPQNQFFLASKNPASVNGPSVEVAAVVDQEFLMKPKFEELEKWDENYLSDGEGEMLEDTEEINALLYSDSDDDDEYDEDDGEKDEVTSKGHSPFSIEESHNKDEPIHELAQEEVASFDDSPKRQRLLDGNYKKSSFAISCNYEDDVASSCAGDRNFDDDDYDDIDSNNRDKKVKIRQALRMLEGIIPELNSNDPLSIIDEAIVYLKSMKIEAEALGLGHLA